MSKQYFVEWRSRDTCLAMGLAEDTVLPREIPLTLGETADSNEMYLAKFVAGDYEVRQNGRVFGRTKTDHEGRFERTVKRGKEAV